MTLSAKFKALIRDDLARYQAEGYEENDFTRAIAKVVASECALPVPNGPERDEPFPGETDLGEVNETGEGQ